MYSSIMVLQGTQGNITEAELLFHRNRIDQQLLFLSTTSAGPVPVRICPLNGYWSFEDKS